MELTSELKQCSKCIIEKPHTQFRKYANGQYGQTCKQCLNELDKLRKINIRQKNLETLTTCEKCNEQKPLYNFAKLKKFYKKKICKSCYVVFLKEQKTEWCRNERDKNINYRIKKSLAARLRSVLDKKDTTMNYIGCNIQYLREWFEYNFTDEMNWSNYGSFWSIDHIIPVCKFDLTVEDEKMKCWNWTNMIPVPLLKKVEQKHSVNLAPPLSKVVQIENILEKLKKFKEEGSTTKWFSSEFIFFVSAMLIL
jgi:hypothetical protein